MAKISLCMIVKNESFFLKKMLLEFKNSFLNNIINEIIIVDTGSNDNTKEIVKKISNKFNFNFKIYDFKWNNNFSNARNFSLSKATGDWILVLDADEIILEKELEILKSIIEKQDKDAFYLIQKNYLNDNDIYAEKNEFYKREIIFFKLKFYKNLIKKYAFFIPNPVIRIFKNNKKIKFQGVIHEIVDETIENKKIGYLDIPIHHFITEKNKNSLKERQLKYLEIAESYLKEKPDGRLYATAAAIYADYFKDYEKSIDYFQKAFYLNYKKEKMQESIADCYIFMKKYNKAVKIYNDLIKNSYITISMCNNISNLLIMSNNKKQALKILNFALTLNGNKEHIKKRIKELNKE